MCKRMVIQKMRMPKIFAATAMAILCSLSAGRAFATDYIWIPDASLLKWQIAGNGVFFRNLNSFDPAALGCCYNFSLDYTTVDGKAKWAVIFAKTLTKEGVYIAVTSKTSPSNIEQVGVW